MTTHTTLPAPTILRRSAQNAWVIDGKAAAAALTHEIAAKVRGENIVPGLAVVLVGQDPASQVYVKAKGKTAKECGFHSVQIDLPMETSQDELLVIVKKLNLDPTIHGILVQMPLPRAIDPSAVIAAISPHKDVDGFHPLNVGLLASGEAEKALVACTPAGAMRLIRIAAEHLGQKLAGANAVVVGRSNIVGKPMAQLLLASDCTVTIAHSRTKALAAVVRGADIVVAAVGRPGMVRGDWIKPGAIVVDVGINRLNLPDGKSRLVGDVAFDEALAHAGAITPVPGGAGPITIAMLMHNTLIAALRAVPSA